jgi:MOSC domain-containing protein YiiM
LRGDRYSNRTGYWSGVDECQVTFIEAEILDRIIEETGLNVGAGEHRRNIVTRGIRLAQLLGKRFAVGKALFEYDRPRPPCQHVQSLTAPGMARALFGQRGGIGARVVRSGFIQVGDGVVVAGEE